MEGVYTLPTGNSDGLHVNIPAQPVTVARGIITSYIVSIEKYSSGGHQSRFVNVNQNSSSETVTFNGLSTFVCTMCCTQDSFILNHKFSSQHVLYFYTYLS